MELTHGPGGELAVAAHHRQLFRCSLPYARPPPSPLHVFNHQAYKCRAEFQLLDSCGYFLDNLDRIGSQDWRPTDEDILHARISTKGIVSAHRFTIEAEASAGTFEVVDVGGQKNERKKWKGAFDGLTAVVFMVAASEFDTDMRERKVPKNRMVDALECFEEIFSHFPEENPPHVIVFLNKIDQFREKIESGERIQQCSALEDYAGDPHSVDAMVEFIGGKFLERIPATQRQEVGEVYVKPTIATDPKLMGSILKVVTTAAMRKDMHIAYEEW